MFLPLLSATDVYHRAKNCKAARRKATNHGAEIEARGTIDWEREYHKIWWKLL